MKSRENNEFEDLIEAFKQQYLNTLSRLTGNAPRSYGFEYEFLPVRPLAASDLDAIGRVLQQIGFMSTGKGFINRDNSMRVEFEPGGQIEYCSPPLKAENQTFFEELTSTIRQTNAAIKERLGIEYIGTDYLPGRAVSPLCLTTERYRHLHDRLSRVGSRGLEMMKGTASIHLHVVISNFKNLLPLFNALCELSIDDHFCMSWNRRDIWDHTDPTRCGRPPCCFADLKTPDDLIYRLIRFALHAEVLGENIPFAEVENQSFDAFLNHMTTIFTDVRFNLKGPTLELRTLDSMPVCWFGSRWKRFIEIMENI